MYESNMSRSIGAKSYTPDVLAEAAKLVQGGSLTLSCAAKSYGIPKTTLHDKIKGRYATNKTGPRTVLSPAEETRLAEWAVSMSRIGYGRTRQELLTTVKKILDDDGRKTPFKDNRPGKDWYRGFVKRHPELTERAPMQLGKERAVITPSKISNWFSELEFFVNNELNDPCLLSDPSRLYNADESGFPLCPKSGRIIAMKGEKNVYNCTSSNKTQITVLACVSAIGHYIKPMIVYPGERVRADILEGFQEAAIGRSPNGWMESELFLTWITDVFIPFLDERQVKRPILLLVDGHSTHVTLEVSDVCKANGIHVFCLLEHASHLIQPLDLRVFGVLKENWSQARHCSENSKNEAIDNLQLKT
ncbi:uncharacterized protein LOC132717417 [Ruditapes philippinarum]|uniref:uncharacterized protein LOC132717417 n=1 Tax=Ruditapes philippinarum TaxID=129788 RepID=UPI00295AD9C6|nr:uncharacterized protein LOC132717417 [Ruditapes philippinarum]